ncbi:MAG: hypothetical protein ABH811_02800 [archaeon]
MVNKNPLKVEVGKNYYQDGNFNYRLRYHRESDGIGGDYFFKKIFEVTPYLKNIRKEYGEIIINSKLTPKDFE